MTARSRVWGWVKVRPWLAVLVISMAGQLGAWQALEHETHARVAATEAERHDRCVNGRHDIQHALEQIVTRLAPNMSQARREQFEAVLHETLSTKDC